jgi:hypothetical protein
MARARSVYRCTECGHDHPKWAGRCEGCGAWNTVAEEPLTLQPVRRAARGREGAPVNRLRDIAEPALGRWKTGLDEFDFVLGGGIVPGSMILVGGEPGIGTSTISGGPEPIRIDLRRVLGQPRIRSQRSGDVLTHVRLGFLGGPRGREADPDIEPSDRRHARSPVAATESADVDVEWIGRRDPRIADGVELLLHSL